MKHVLVILFLISSSICFSQQIDHIEPGDSPYAERDFLIIASTKNIKEAFELAKIAAKKTGFIFKDNALQKDTTIGATFPVDSCKTNGFEYPCYVARGRYDDGGYISVEYSNAYDGFKKGYFIVIAANGYKDNEQFKAAVKKVKTSYPKSYVKRTRVFLGCLH